VDEEDAWVAICSYEAHEAHSERRPSGVRCIRISEEGRRGKGISSREIANLDTDCTDYTEGWTRIAAAEVGVFYTDCTDYTESWTRIAAAEVGVLTRVKRKAEFVEPSVECSGHA
jgi:hypothetical protein